MKKPSPKKSLKSTAQTEEILRLASFTKFNPRPMVEIDLKGNVIYANPSSDVAFPDLRKKGAKHPYLANLPTIVKTLKQGSKSFNRDIEINKKWFRHFFYYIPDFNSIAVYGLDITDKKLAEYQARESEKRYHLLFEKMNYGYALQDIIFDHNKKPVDYRFMDVNPAFEKLSKLKKTDIIGKTANQITPSPKTKEEITNRKKYNSVAITGKPVYFESYNEKLHKYFEFYAYKPNYTQIALIFSDITHRKKTDEEKNNFISIMSHELRNPLTPIIANAQFIQIMLRKERLVNPEIKESVEIIEKQAHLMAGLLNDILDVSRLSRNKIELKKRLVNIVDIVKSSVKASMPFINTKNQTISVFFSQERILAQVDPLRIEQIMINLINNASKYTYPNGHIEVHCGLKNDLVLVRVKDNGIGISVKKINRIFDLFSDESQPFMGIGGLGIGLNIVKNLVAMHQGTISVVSKGENKGSEFTILLPLPKALLAIQKAPSSKKILPVSQKSRALKVLIVDDNEEIRNAISKLLYYEGYQIKSTHNGQNAIKIFKSFKPNTVLIDIGLPDMNGYQIAKILRQHDQAENKKTNLIAFTGYGQNDDKQRAREAGFDHHLTKPVDINHLIKLI